MWVSDDSEFDVDFIRRLVNVMMEHADAAVAFLPYEKVDIEGNAISGERCCEYSNDNTLLRLMRFVIFPDDAVIYGLYRRNVISSIDFPYWRGVNREVLINWAYPVIFDVLLRGTCIVDKAGGIGWRYLVHDRKSYVTFVGESLLRKRLNFLVRRLNMYDEYMKRMSSRGFTWVGITVIFSLAFFSFIKDIINLITADGKTFTKRFVMRTRSI